MIKQQLELHCPLLLCDQTSGFEPSSPPPPKPELSIRLLTPVPNQFASGRGPLGIAFSFSCKAVRPVLTFPSQVLQLDASKQALNLWQGNFVCLHVLIAQWVVGGYIRISHPHREMTIHFFGTYCTASANYCCSPAEVFIECGAFQAPAALQGNGK